MIKFQSSPKFWGKIEYVFLSKPKKLNFIQKLLVLFGFEIENMEVIDVWKEKGIL